jgi:hypothetical protein
MTWSARDSDVIAGSLQDRHLHALFVIEMNLERRLRDIMMIVEVARQRRGREDYRPREYAQVSVRSSARRGLGL